MASGWHWRERKFGYRVEPSSLLLEGVLQVRIWGKYLKAAVLGSAILCSLFSVASCSKVGDEFRLSGSVPCDYGASCHGPVTGSDMM